MILIQKLTGRSFRKICLNVQSINTTFLEAVRLLSDKPLAIKGIICFRWFYGLHICVMCIMECFYVFVIYLFCCTVSTEAMSFP